MQVATQEQVTSLSEHAQKRLQQRAVRVPFVEVALRYGKRERSHGDRLYILTDRALLNTPYEHLADRLRGLCVVVTPSGVVKTVKWIYHLRRRPSVLRGIYQRQRRSP